MTIPLKKNNTIHRKHHTPAITKEEIVLFNDTLNTFYLRFYIYIYIYRISNELSFITKFITWVGKHDIMRGSAEHNIIFANECNKFSNKWQRIWDFIYYITVKTIGISIFQL